MEKSRKEEIYQTLQKLSELANDICLELHDLVDIYYDHGDVCNKLKNLAIDADALSMSLEDNELLSDTTSCFLQGKVLEIGNGDPIGFINIDGTVDVGYVIDISSDSNPADVILSISKKEGGNLFSKRHISKVIDWLHWMRFEQCYWNKMVESLANQKKSVSLSLQNDTFNIKVFDDELNVLFERDNLYFRDLNKNLINELKGT